MPDNEIIFTGLDLATGEKANTAEETNVAAPDVEIPTEKEPDTREPEDEKVLEARKRNWLPKGEYKGNPDLWVDADEYLKRTDIKYTRKALASVEAQLAQMQRETVNALAEVRRNERERLQKEYDAQIAALKNQKKQGFEVGDFDGMERADEQVRRLEAEKTERIQRIGDPAQPQGNPDAAALVNQFIERNKGWYQADKERTFDADSFMAGMVNNILEQKRSAGIAKPTLTIDETKMIVEKVEKVFAVQPPKAETSQNHVPPAVAAGRNFTPSKGKGARFSDLPAEAQNDFKALQKYGLFKSGDPAADQAKYLKSYQQTHGAFMTMGDD